MQYKVIPLPDEAQCNELESFLIERIYEFNAKVTGYDDGRLLAGEIRNEQAEIIAGFKEPGEPGGQALHLTFPSLLSMLKNSQ